MKKLFNKMIFLPIITLVLILISLSGPALPSSAAGSVDLFIDTESKVPVGQNFTVTFRVETDIAAMVNLEIYYDNSVLHCASVDTSADPGATFNDNGSVIRVVTMSFKTSHKYVCRFRFTKEGNVKFKASVIECGTLEAEMLPTPTLEKTVSGYKATPVPTQKPTPTPTTKPTEQRTPAPTEKPTQTPVPTTPANTQTPSYTPFNPSANPDATPSSPFEFSDGNELRYIAEDFETDTVTMPENFEKRSIKYEGSDISVAENQNGVKLLYTTDVLGQNGKFYIYIEKQKAIIPYLEIPFGKNVYVFTMLDEMPESFTQTALNFDQTPAIAYNTNNEKYSDFRILYGFTKGGALSHYLYDTKEGTLQRCADPSILYTTNENNSQNGENIPTDAPTENPTVEPTASPDRIPVYPKNDVQFDKKILIPIIIAICVAAVLIAIIIIIVRSRRIAERFDADYTNFVAQPEENIDYSSDGEENYEIEDTSVAFAAEEPEVELESETESNTADDEYTTEDIAETDIAETEIAEESTVESFSSYYNLDDDEDEILQLRND